MIDISNEPMVIFSAFKLFPLFLSNANTKFNIKQFYFTQFNLT